MNVYEQNKNVVSCDTEMVLVDIVGFSKLSGENQAKTAIVINGELERGLELSSSLSARDLNEVVAGFVPTGDGFYVVLQPRIVGYGLSLAISLRSNLLIASERANGLYEGVRVASHFGSVFEFKDITGKENFVGPGMNDCARILGIKLTDAPPNFLEDNNFIIASEASLVAHDALYDSVDAKNYFSTLGLKRSEAVIVTDKHGINHDARFIEFSRRVAFNPPPPHNYELRVKKRLSKYMSNEG
jgi:hypothetical protein